MALVQKLKVDYLTFGEIEDKILSRVLREGEDCCRVDVILDVCREISMKSAERELRGASDAVTFKNITAGQKVKQFKNFLCNGNNKTCLVRFVVEHWQKLLSRKRLKGNKLYVTSENRCIKITAEKVEEQKDLSSEQVAADT
eukprot:gene14-9611_t